MNKVRLKRFASVLLVACMMSSAAASPAFATDVAVIGEEISPPGELEQNHGVSEEATATENDPPEGGVADPALGDPATGEDDAWFQSEESELDEAPTSSGPEGSVRARSVEFDADAALASLVAPEDLLTVLPGERRVLTPLVSSFSFESFDETTVEVTLLEVAAGISDPDSPFPSVEVQGETTEGDLVSFVFVPDDNGSYSLVGSLTGEESPRLEVAQIDEAAYRLDEVTLAAADAPTDEAPHTEGSDACLG
uniref:hypothetical protein n=1 Tax=Leucobacter celer TaxID=668625 RepID=UPI000ACE537F